MGPSSHRKPDVSVVIAVHNEEKYIGRCIRSIQNQNYPEDRYEIIVVDDGSDDRTSYALGMFSNEIRILRHQNKKGLPSALNTGIRAAQGRFVVRLDGDDYVSPEYLNTLTNFLTMNAYMDAVACDYFVVDDKEEIRSRENCLRTPLGCGVMFRIEQLVEIGLYDPNFLLHEDKDLLARFLKKYKVHRVELPLYRYRRHEANMTNETEKDRIHSELFEKKHGFTIHDRLL